MAWCLIASLQISPVRSQQFDPLRSTSGNLTPRFEMDYISPAVHKWYAPRNLAQSYVRPWYVENFRHADQLYSHYVEPQLGGVQEWYDGFGRRLGAGWLVYAWEQAQPARNGSDIEFGSVFNRFFDNLIVSGDEAGGGSYRLMIGRELGVYLTPLTMFKPGFDGLRLDHATDRLESTLLVSRPSQPGNGRRTNATQFFGGHSQVRMADNATLGFTYINAHNANTDQEFSIGNPLKGTLTADQNRSVSMLWVRIRDDSPTSDTHGAVVYRHDIVFTDTSGNKIRGSDLGLLPSIEGGRESDGALVADGSETLLLAYDLAAMGALGLETSAVTGAVIELAVADDYRIELASDLQTDGQRQPQTVFLPYSRAAGNVQDQSNGRVVKLDYGLPTANELIGLNWDLIDWRGLSFQGEYVANLQRRQYPSLLLDSGKHHEAIKRASATYGVGAYQWHPLTLFVEGFSIDDDYSTNYWLTLSNGVIQYDAPVPMLYEFVDDDDDFDSVPEWQRPYQLSSNGLAWPGVDSNNDNIYDYNQNNDPRPTRGNRNTEDDRPSLNYITPGRPPSPPQNRNRNLIPDYAEPFLRFRSDRPEFLFGLDMNHNGMADPFENDLIADYPYKPDHRGFNAHLKVDVTPEVRLIGGRQSMRLISGDGRTRSWYGMLAWEQVWGRNRIRLFDFGASVRDDIVDHLQVWTQPIGAVGRMRDEPDELPAQDTWRNLLYADLEQQFGDGLRVSHRLKVDRFWQRRPRAQVVADEGRMRSGFVGVINRAEWTLPIGLGVVEPRWKSEFRQDRPFSSRQPTARSIEQAAFLMWSQPVFAERASVNYHAGYGRQIFDSQIQLGFELRRFWMLDGERVDEDQDFLGQTVIFQLINRTGYLGYQLVTRVGLQWQRRNLEHAAKEQASTVFISINAGQR
ncbi:MAG: hypothetical protein HN712_17595 [Gemmatimonadetes bacterium]|nr:hypothetical protein [Gemmatimonadota bacterium]MBT7862135.1 hypothetical protein [Gemmatimonadota bacterium]